MTAVYPIFYPVFYPVFYLTFSLKPCWDYLINEVSSYTVYISYITIIVRTNDFFRCTAIVFFTSETVKIFHQYGGNFHDKQYGGSFVIPGRIPSGLIMSKEYGVRDALRCLDISRFSIFADVL